MSSYFGLFHFGVLRTEIVRYILGYSINCYRYSKDIVYNNSPFPTDSSAAARQAVEEAAQAVLDVRTKWQSTSKTVAHLYDPDKMPADLLAAYQTLDRAVEGVLWVEERIFERGGEGWVVVWEVGFVH